MLAADPLVEILKPARPTAVVDIGANPIDGEPPYKKMLAGRLCSLVGFEPQPEALATLNARKSDLETYLPYAVGDGSTRTLHVCHARGMTSLFEPEPRILECFQNFTEFGKVVERIPVTTRTLDSIHEIPALDMLKIDVQGAELSVFRGGSARLSSAVAIHSEVSMVPLYRNQPVYGDIDLALRALGFLPHMFAHINKRMLLPLRIDNQPYAAMNQLLELDVVYVRDFTQPERMDAEQLKHLALIAHHVYASYDLATRCITELVQRGSVAADAVGRYLNSLKGG